jgi:hypothetical protein
MSFVFVRPTYELNVLTTGFSFPYPYTDHLHKFLFKIDIKGNVTIEHQRFLRGNDTPFQTEVVEQIRDNIPVPPYLIKFITKLIIMEPPNTGYQDKFDYFSYYLTICKAIKTIKTDIKEEHAYHDLLESDINIVRKQLGDVTDKMMDERTKNKILDTRCSVLQKNKIDLEHTKIDLEQTIHNLKQRNTYLEKDNLYLIKLQDMIEKGMLIIKPDK